MLVIINSGALCWWPLKRNDLGILKTGRLAAYCNMVLDFTISVCTSVHVILSFLCLIISSVLALSYFLASYPVVGIRINSKRHKKGDNEVEQVIITWTACHRNGKIRDYSIRLALVLYIPVQNYINYIWTKAVIRTVVISNYFNKNE